MTFHCHLEFNDILALQKDVIQHSYTHHIKKMYYKWVLAVAVFLAIVFPFGPSLTSAMVGAVAVVIVLLAFPSLYNKAAFSRSQSQMAKQDYSSVLGPCKITLTDTGIEREISGDVTFFDWADFTRLGEDDTHYFLYQTDLNGLVLPKDPGDLNAEETADYHDRVQASVQDGK
ncbi:hypothetical protein JNUCC1_01414 [Lentibacillus sp. JNUCC-1]|nr:hypothetical protein [Lentibacillus sp. JNUCC-1]